MHTCGPVSWQLGRNHGGRCDDLIGPSKAGDHPGGHSTGHVKRRGLLWVVFCVSHGGALVTRPYCWTHNVCLLPVVCLHAWLPHRELPLKVPRSESRPASESPFTASLSVVHCVCKRRGECKSTLGGKRWRWRRLTTDQGTSSESHWSEAAPWITFVEVHGWLA